MDSKRVAESLFTAIDFSYKMQSGETLSSPTCTVSVWAGVDPGPALTVSGLTTGGTIVNSAINGGLAGVIYLLAYKVVGSVSGLMEIDCLQAVLPQGM